MPALAADRWEEAGSGAVAILPLPKPATAITGGSFYCSEQRWAFLLRPQWLALYVVVIGFGMHVQHFPNAIETRKGFRDLGPNGREFNHRHRHQPCERDIHHQIAESHTAGNDSVASHDEDNEPDSADDDG